MSPENELELCHVLLTELLAYQFASPVRWIETQDVFLNEFKSERIIEIGPQPILTNIALRTLKMNEESEAATGMIQHREVYCVSKDLDNIYYYVEPKENDQPEISGSGSAVTNVAKHTATKSIQPVIAPVSTPAATPISSQNKFVTPPKFTSQLVVSSIIASKMPTYNVNTLPLQQPIKELTKGKSTLQNEIKGDLLKEFPQLNEFTTTPLEDVALTEMLEMLDSTSLGPVTSEMVTKHIPRVFSGKFSTVSGVRQYLSQTWGLKTEEQDTVLLFTSMAGHSGRLNDETEIKSCIDRSCHELARYQGIDIVLASLPECSAGECDDDEKPKFIDIETFNLFTEDLVGLQQKQHQILGNHLNVSNTNDKVQKLEAELQAMKLKFSQIELEFGNYFIDQSLTQLFSPKKVRTYDSFWNWSRQSFLKLFYTVIEDPQCLPQVLTQDRVRNLINRADEDLIEIMEYLTQTRCKDQILKQVLTRTITQCRQACHLFPSYSNTAYESSKPIMNISNAGEITITEKMRDDSSTVAQYIKEVSLGSTTRAENGTIVSTKLDHDMTSYFKVETELFQVYSKIIQYALASNNSPNDLRSQFESVYEQLLIFLRNSDQIASFFRGIINEALQSLNKPLYAKDGHESVIVDQYEVYSSDDDSSYDSDSDSGRPVNDSTTTAVIPKGVIPFLHMKRRSNVTDEWVYDKDLTQLYLDRLLKIGYDGLNFSDKTTLITTVDGEDSLVQDIIKSLLQTGCKVIVAIKEFDLHTTRKFQNCYREFGSKGSQLVVLPLNMGSKIDIQKFCKYFYSNFGDIDFVLPFHTEVASGTLTELGSDAEYGQRSMSTNLLRLLGNIVQEKRKQGIRTRPTHVLVPLSPNHGGFGNDGLFSESRKSLECILSKWYVEDWADDLTLCGCIFGWTRNGSDGVIAQGLEKLGVRTFSTNEMAFNVLGLLTYGIVTLAQASPLLADLNGGLHTLPNIGTVVSQLKSDANNHAGLNSIFKNEKKLDQEIVNGIEDLSEELAVTPRGNFEIDFPQLKPYEELKSNFNGSDLEGLVDLSNVVVITGFSEVGPWGNSRTRWEMESRGEFSLEGCLEMAWIMGLIRYKSSSQYTGWVDAKTEEPVHEFEIKKRYEMQILKHSGIRIIEPSLFEGYNPDKKQLLHEVIVNEDLQPVQMSKELADQYKLEHGDKVELYPLAETNNNEYLVKFLRGSSLYIPKALRFDRLVAGQIPTGWDAKRYGIPEDIISQVDPVTLYALIATAEALITSGISEPYELYKYVHVSEVGNCSGSGIGGLRAHGWMQKLRTKDEPVQNDILPETFNNVMAAWVNMLMLSSSGPIKTPVGACATAVESLDLGVETILTGKAKVCIVGGYDDFSEDLSYEFAKMGATSNSIDELENGRAPKEMCRPATTTRNGFMEAQGAGIQVLMRADIAVEMGVPIYGVLGLASTASDKISKSVPAPGKGVLTCAREHHGDAKFPSPKLNIGYRKRQLERRCTEITQWLENEVSMGNDVDLAQEEASKQLKEAKSHWGNYFWRNDSRISPVRGCLATFGLSIDDLNVASFHGTSTKANEKNESQILNKMMEHMGRSDGNPLLGVFQKHLTGHPKGAAGAWMTNGVLQILNSGIVPGNKNADNVDNNFRQYKHIVYPSESIYVGNVKAASVTAFGFGQKGAIGIFINPNYLLACLSRQEYSQYKRKLENRHRLTQRHFNDGMVTNSIFVAKSDPPYSPKSEEEVYLEPLARVKESSKGDLGQSKVIDMANSTTGRELSVAVVDHVSDLEMFELTEHEKRYCFNQPDSNASLCGTLAAKRSVVDLFDNLKIGGIEIKRDGDTGPKVYIDGYPAAVDVSISHDDTKAVAIAMKL